MVALCERGFVAPKNRAEFLLKTDIMHINREQRPEKEGVQEADEAPRNESLDVC